MLCAGESNEERAPILWWFIAPPLENGVDGLEQGFATDGLENGVTFQLLEVRWPFHRPRLRTVTMSPKRYKRLPNRVAHAPGIIGTERCNTHPAMCAEML